MIIIKYWEFLVRQHLMISKKRIEKWRGNTIQTSTQMTMPQKSSLKKFRQHLMYLMIRASGKCTIGTEVLLKALEQEEEGGWSPQGQAGGFQSGGEVDLESLFGGGGFADLFGGGKRRTRRNPRTPGEDITANIRIPFQLAIDGGKTEVRFERDNKHETLSITIPQGTSGRFSYAFTGPGEARPWWWSGWRSSP